MNQSDETVLGGLAGQTKDRARTWATAAAGSWSAAVVTAVTGEPKREEPKRTLRQQCHGAQSLGHQRSGGG
jgi:hypothetical protein